MIIEKPKITEEQFNIATSISDKFGLGIRTAKILVSRGVDTLDKAEKFLNAGKHNFLSKSQMNKVEEDLRKGEYHLLNRMISWGNQEYLFYDDDIYQYLKKGSGIKNCVEKLKNQICGEE